MENELETNLKNQDEPQLREDEVSNADEQIKLDYKIRHWIR